jgi:sec-independent protein translocase protein TatB
MFDVGFTELLVIGIVALIVIGPEKLPSVARTLGHLLGRAQRYVNDVKSDINREMQLEELKKLQAQVQTQMTDATRSFEQSINQGILETKAMVESVSDSTTVVAPDAAPAATELLDHLDEPKIPSPAPAAAPPAVGVTSVPV